MNKSYLAASLLLLVLIATAAQAQIYDTSYPTGEVEKLWNIHMGAAFLQGDTENSVEFIGGVERLIPAGDMLSGIGGAFSISADYIPVRSGGDTVSLFPILFNYKKGALVSENYRVFGGLGIGIYLATDDIPAMDLSDGTSFAWNIQAGLNITPEWLFQVRYIAGSHPGDDGMITTELGYKF